MSEALALNEDFADVLTELAEADAQFLIVGAHALAVHGAARATGDIDVWVRASPENASRVHRALTNFGAPLAAHGVGVHELTKPNLVYQIGLPPRRIDILTSISGVSFDEAWPKRFVREVGGQALPFLGVTELIANKKATGRAKDLADLALLAEVDPPTP